jgi:hypothetical protein
MGKKKKRVAIPNTMTVGGMISNQLPDDRFFLSGDVRSNLVTALAAAVDHDHANVIVDALDMYLEVESQDRAPAFHLPAPPNLNVELDKVRKERDEAVARAEKAEEKLRAPRQKSKGKLK